MTKQKEGQRVALIAGRAVDSELDVSGLTAAGFAVDKHRELENVHDEKRLIAELGSYWGIVAGGEAYSRTVLSALPHLRIVSRMGVGFDRVDVAAATERGVAVTITPNTIEPAVAEWTLTHILAARRRLFQADRAVREGKWTLPDVLGGTLVGATVGLIGLGRIGREVAARLAGFGCAVIGSDPLANAAEWRARHVDVVDLPTLLERSDVVSLHVPLLDSTRNLISAAELARMKSGAIIVNTSRGGLIDEAALAAALRAGKIAGAGLDAFAEEPLPASSPLLGFDNVIVTGHVAFATRAAARSAAQNAINAVVALAEGKTPTGLLNPDAIKQRAAARN